MAGTRDGAIARIEAEYDSGNFIEVLAERVAIQTESQELCQLPELYRYLNDNISPYLAPLGYNCEIFDNLVEGGGPFLVATRIEDPARPTLLVYGHGDVVRGIPEQWRDGLNPWVLKQEGDRYYGRGTADNKVQHSIRKGLIRLSLHIYNTGEDIAEVLALAREWRDTKAAA